MRKIWWWILPIIYLLAWQTSWCNPTVIEALLFSLMFVVPYLMFREDKKINVNVQFYVPFFERIIETGMLLLVSVVPLIIDARANDAIFIKTVFSQIIIFGIAIVWALKCVWERKFSFLKLPAVIPVLAFWGWCIITSVFSQYKYASIGELFRFSSYILLFFVMVNNIKELEQVRRILITFLITASLTAVYGICQHFGWDFISWQSQFSTPSSFGSPYFYGGYLTLVIPLVIPTVLTIFLIRGDKLWKKFLAGAFAALLLVALYYTKSRTSLVGVTGGIIFFAVLKLKIIGFKNFFADRKKMFILAAALIAIIAGINFATPNVRHYFKSAIVLVRDTAAEVPRLFFNPDTFRTESPERNLAVRMTIWQGAYKVFLSNPVFGTGLGVFQHVFPRHRPSFYHFIGVSHNTKHAFNELIEVSAEMGIIGLAIFIWVIVTIFRTTIKTFTNAEGSASKDLQLALLAGIFACLIDSLGSSSLRWVNFTFLWLMMGLVIILVKLKVEVKTEPEDSLRFEQFIEAIETARKESPNPTRVIISLILVFLASGFFCVQIVKPFIADIYLRKGLFYHNVPNEWDNAIFEYEEALVFEPANIEVQYKLAYIHARRKEWNETLKSYLDLARLAPDYTQVHYNIGLTYYNLNRINEAISEFEKTVELDNSSYFGYYMLGICYSAQNRWGKAVDAYKNAVAAKRKIAPIEEVSFRFPEAHLNMADIYYCLGRVDEAAIEYKNVLAIDSMNVEAARKLKLIKESKEKAEKMKAKIIKKQEQGKVKPASKKELTSQKKPVSMQVNKGKTAGKAKTVSKIKTVDKSISGQRKK